MNDVTVKPTYWDRALPAALAAYEDSRRKTMVTHEIGRLGREQPDNRELEITRFCDNLKQSMLRHVREGQDVFIDSKSDIEPVTGTPDYGECVVDAIYRGGSVAVHFGWPAERKRDSKVRDSKVHYLEQRVAHEAWMHAACLSIAETGQKWGPNVRPSPAMKAVYELRQERDRLLEQLYPPITADWTDAPQSIVEDIRAMKVPAEEALNTPREWKGTIELAPPAGLPQLCLQVEKLSPQPGDVLVLHVPDQPTPTPVEDMKDFVQGLHDYLCREPGSIEPLIVVLWEGMSLEQLDGDDMRARGWERVKPVRTEEDYRDWIQDQIVKGLGIPPDVVGVVDGDYARSDRIYGPSPLKKAFEAWQASRKLLKTDADGTQPVEKPNPCPTCAEPAERVVWLGPNHLQYVCPTGHRWKVKKPDAGLRRLREQETARFVEQGQPENWRPDGAPDQEIHILAVESNESMEAYKQGVPAAWRGEQQPGTFHVENALPRFEPDSTVSSCPTCHQHLPKVSGGDPDQKAMFACATCGTPLERRPDGTFERAGAVMAPEVAAKEYGFGYEGPLLDHKKTGESPPADAAQPESWRDRPSLL